MLTRELGHGEVWLDVVDGHEVGREEDAMEQTESWLFDRAIPAGRLVIACFHDIAEPGEEIQIALRQEEAVKMAKAILG